ncbi:Solute carrier organic anion transporter family member 1A5, partial [Microtus ochrogaster]
FLLALTVAYIVKSISANYMVSMLTQIERQFNIPTTAVGLINGSFEIGNLLLIVFVSYFGTKLHRPIMIGAGCMVMGLGCFLISLPHFLMGRYEYEKMISPSSNLSSNSFLCSGNRSQTLLPTPDPEDCEKEIKSLMWMYVMVGNLIRGIGETPIMPLGVSYIEDFVKSENSPLYIGILETGNMIGPFIGLLFSSFCANIYVDFGSVNTDDLTITPTDTRWVGAWWLGFLIFAGVNVLISIPFFFFPKTLPKEELEDNADVTNSNKEEKHQGKAKKEKRGITKGKQTNLNPCIWFRWVCRPRTLSPLRRSSGSGPDSPFASDLANKGPTSLIQLQWDVCSPFCVAFPALCVPLQLCRSLLLPRRTPLVPAACLCLHTGPRRLLLSPPVPQSLFLIAALCRSAATATAYCSAAAATLFLKS